MYIMYVVTWLRMLNVKNWTNFQKLFHRLLHVIANIEYLYALHSSLFIFIFNLLYKTKETEDNLIFRVISCICYFHVYWDVDFIVVYKTNK